MVKTILIPRKIMSVKNAVKLLNAEIKKVKDQINDWHDDIDDVFTNLKIDWKKEYDNLSKDLKQNCNPKHIGLELKNFEKMSQKMINIQMKKIMDMNQKNSSQLKSVTQGLGQFAKPYLDSVKRPIFSTNIKAQPLIEKQLGEFIKSECLEYISDNIAETLEKKLISITKDFKTSQEKQDQHIQQMAKIEFFCHTLLKATEEPFMLPKKTQTQIDENPILSNVINNIKLSFYIENIDKALNEVKDTSLTHVNNLSQSYGKALDEDCLKRSKLAMKGVRQSLAEWVQNFGNNADSLMEDMDSQMSKMYLQDALDHLNLARACLKNDSLEMKKYYDMDTASRDLIDDRLYNYLHSDEFEDNIKNSKKLKRKI